MQPGGMQKKALSEGMIRVFLVFSLYALSKKHVSQNSPCGNITTYKSLRLPYELYYFWEEVLASESQVLMSHWKYGKKGRSSWKGRQYG